MTDAAIVTRFAPSPTGFLHIGGARTALFNWLFARGRGGKFLLRIEDTDRARYTPEAVEAILDGLRWLGLDWDDEAISQFDRLPRHAAAVDSMLAAGTAYRCYATREEIDAAREAAKAAGRPPLFLSPWRDATAEDAPDGAPFTVRLKAPREGETVIEDAVQGKVTWANSTLDDLIVMRSDGTPTYMLAVVVDDHEMGVTHVIRGDDHLTNAARQALIYDALGWETPIFAHVPLIHGPDGAKLSKRHGALGIEAYREMGYLPAALRNYLARLSWSHGDEEFFTTEQATEWFGLEGVGKSAARFDFKKLESLNGQHIRASDTETLMTYCLALREASGAEPLDDATRAAFAGAMDGLKERAKTLNELLDLAGYIFDQRPLEFDEKAAKALTDDSRTLLTELTSHLQHVSSWEYETLEACLKNFAENNGLKLGKIAQPLRAALTGRAVSPGIFDVMITLGRDETLARIKDQHI